METETKKENKNDYLCIRIDRKLKDDFAEFCSKSGISMSAAVNQLVVASKKEGAIPFTVRVVEYETNMPKELTRASIRVKPSLRQDFMGICDRIGIPMSTVVKMFMMQCLELGRFPFGPDNK